MSFLRERFLVIVALACLAASFALPSLSMERAEATLGLDAPLYTGISLLLLASLVTALRIKWGLISLTITGFCLFFAGLGLARGATGLEGWRPGPAYWALVTCCWLAAWVMVERMVSSHASRRVRQLSDVLVPLAFGVTVIFLWEVITRAGNVPQVILPPPSMIWARITASVPTLLADFQQTFLKAVLIGYALGCGLGFAVAILIDRSPFLKSGLLPLGNFVSALPIVGVAPIMVMWFGFDWPSKAAVVVIMTFFPMLVNTVAGLNASSAIERDLMRTYAAGYWQTLMKLRLPAAGPFIFNALKINSTLALIGAIVAEFFGTPIVGMGFRISTEVGRMNVDMVWAEIAVAAVAGSVFYGVIVLIERGVTFWHPSVRGA